MRNAKVAWVLWWALPALAQRPLTLVEILSLETPENARLSPDGSQVLLEISSADWKLNRRVSHIWRAPVEGGPPVKMTSGGRDTAPAWAPDGRRFAFLRRSGDRVQLFVQAASGGEADPWTQHDTAVTQPAWSPDGSRLYFLAADSPAKGPQGLDDAYLFEQNRSNHHLWEITAASKERRITEGGFDIREYGAAPDGRSIWYVAAPSPLLDDTVKAEIYRLDLGTGEKRRLTDNRVGESRPRLAPDGRQLLFLAPSDPALQDAYHQRGIFLMPAEGGSPRLLAPEFRGEALAAEWAGAHILLLANTGLESQLYRLSPGRGAPEPLTSGPQALAEFHYAAGVDRWAAVISDPASPGDVWVGQRRLTALNSMLKQRPLARVEAYRWKGQDGQPLDGVLVYPIDYQKGRRYPLVSQIHGGPQSASKLTFASYGTNYPQFWAGRGYLCLLPNYRGSSGYGNAFLRDLKGNYFRNSADDVLAGIDSLVRDGVADPEKLGIMGWSAGGIMTNWLITRTDRFKAASSGAGVSNWISQFAQSDVRSHRGFWFGGDPWGQSAPLDAYLKTSAVFFAQRVKTPTLIMVGERDERVPMPQSVEMYRALMRNGATVELLVFPREGHGFQELRHRLAKANKEFGWFEKYIRGVEYHYETPEQ